MPKTLSPTPYVPSGAGSTAGAVSGPSLTAVSSASIGGCVSPSASPVTVSALSHYSSSTAGLLDELQICSLDSPGASPTPSPTLSHVSTYTSTAGPDDVLTTYVASTAAASTVTNVIIPTSHCCNTYHYQKQIVPSFPPLIGMAEPNLHKMYYYYRFLSFTNHQLQSTCQTPELNSAHFVPFFMLMCLYSLELHVYVCLSVFLFVMPFLFAVQCNYTVS